MANEPDNTDTEDFKRPWLMFPLSEWSIVGMNHYFLEGAKKERQLFVAASNATSASTWNRALS